MEALVIRWSKSYNEDLGTPDEAGFYDYAYCYYLYTFRAPTGSHIIVRQYADELARGSLFVYESGQQYDGQAALTRQSQFAAAVVAFLQATAAITRFDLFSGGYQPIDLAELGAAGRFTFVQVPAEAEE